MEHCVELSELRHLFGLPVPILSSKLDIPILLSTMSSEPNRDTEITALQSLLPVTIALEHLEQKDSRFMVKISLVTGHACLTGLPN